MIQVVKANGGREPFNEEKVRESIQRAGINSQMQDQVVAHIEKKLFDNISTADIYKHISEFLVQSPNPYTKTRYGLKEAIMALGPTGYPFEDYIAEILKTQGFSTQTRVILQGNCISHEIDVIASKDSDKENIMVEAKFHNMAGTRTDVHVALYTKARFDDVKEKNGLSKAWLVTNTKATTDAINYGLCAGLKIISWSYPNEESLRELIEKSGLIPITALTTLSQNQKQHLLEEHIVLCRDIYTNHSYLDSLNLPENERKNVIAEAEFVSKY